VISGYKHIELLVGTYIASRYTSVIEVGAGSNLTAAQMLHDAGIPVICTDIIPYPKNLSFPYVVDSIWDPDLLLYRHADCIYSIRPTEEMMGSLIAVAERVNTDLLIYHLGFEGYESDIRPEIIECGVPLMRYIRRQN